jgi:hypothetical protein
VFGQCRGVNGTDNFRAESAFVSVFKYMVCIFRNPSDMDADVDSGQADIRRIRSGYDIGTIRRIWIIHRFLCGLS